MKVLFIWDVPIRLQNHIRRSVNSPEIELIFPEKIDDLPSSKYASEVEVIVGWRPSKDLLNAATSLHLFINPGAGVQHLKGLFDDHQDVTIVNGHGNAFFTAEHIIAMLLSLTNRIIPHHQWMKEGKWRLGDEEAKSVTLNDRVIGLLGYGHVNQEVHQLLKPFGCRFKILKRHPEKGQFQPEELDEFLSEIDVLIIAIPLTDETKGMIGKKELALLGKQAMLINAGRGSIVDESSLYQALKKKIIDSAAIDVWYQYKPEPDKDGALRPYTFPFHELDNILLSPHRAASPMDDLKRWDDVIENIRRAKTKNADYLNIVDLRRGY